MARPTKSKAVRRVGLAVYLDPQILQRLKDAADRDRRSASTQAAIYIELGLGRKKLRPN